MTVEEKVGQTMIWTFAGTSFSPQIRDMLQAYRPGALIAFSRNIKSPQQIARFNFEAQRFAASKLKSPLFLMIDQEGGSVTRVKIRTPLPSALALGQLQNAQFIESFAETSGELLATLGFNVNLAPVMDISQPNSDSFISNRSFGSNPEEVSDLSMAYARGLSAAGLIPSAKHFPGHGGLVADSHIRTPTKLSSLEELESRDLIPFKEFIGASFPRAIMTAHLALPNVDATGTPATYSFKIIHDLLREKYGYQGLVMTDDLEMGGASVSQDIGERTVRAFLAGNDMLMLAGPPKNQRKAFQAMVAAVKSGRISEDRLNESVARILETKKLSVKKSFHFEKNKSLEIRSRLEALSREIMHKNFQDAIKSKTSQWPEIQSQTDVLVMASDPRFFRSFKNKFKGQAHFFPLTPTSLQNAEQKMKQASYSLFVFYASGNKTAKWLTRLNNDLRANMIVVNCNNPEKIDETGFLNVLNINSASPESGEWLARSLNRPMRLRQPAELGLNKSKISEKSPRLRQSSERGFSQPSDASFPSDRLPKEDPQARLPLSSN